MTVDKRKNVDEKSDSGETSKKLKMEDDAPGLSTLQSTMGTIQGPDDASITSLFNTLFYTINNFVHDYFKGSPYSVARKNDQKSKHPGAKEAIIVAAIWNKLIRPLLSAPTRAFNDMMPEKAIRTGTSDNREQFYAWRTLTAHFLSNNYKTPTSWGEGGSRREEFVQDVALLLLDHSVIKDQEKLETGLEGIAEKAYELSTAMACSRAYWECAVRDPRVGDLYGFRIKTDRMDDIDLWDEDEGHGKSTTVDLVKTPMLLKYGNSDGQNYNQCRVVRKAEVVVKSKQAHD
ncbi:hypothetical protein LA080_013759 [Diaporthe eres]|nr:hypothetical protein LA080_013759 [Diaporthe eres]